MKTKKRVRKPTPPTPAQARYLLNIIRKEPVEGFFRTLRDRGTLKIVRNTLHARGLLADPDGDQLTEAGVAAAKALLAAERGK